MVLCLKTRESRSLPGLPSAQDLFRDDVKSQTHGFAAGWSSPVARQAHNLKVVGSNPAPATKSKSRPRKGTAFCFGPSIGGALSFSWCCPGVSGRTTAALGLCRSTRTQGSGLKTALTIQEDADAPVAEARLLRAQCCHARQHRPILLRLHRAVAQRRPLLPCVDRLIAHTVPLGHHRHRVPTRLPQDPNDLLFVNLDFFILPPRRGQSLD